jgi:hypothetical protein
MANPTSTLKTLLDRIFPAEEAKSAAYEEGFRADPDAANPHPDGTADHEQWAKGHDAADVDRRAW